MVILFTINNAHCSTILQQLVALWITFWQTSESISAWNWAFCNLVPCIGCLHEQGVFGFRLCVLRIFLCWKFEVSHLFLAFGKCSCICVLEACQIHIHTVLICLCLSRFLCVWIAEMPLRCFHRNENIWTSRHLCRQNPGSRTHGSVLSQKLLLFCSKFSELPYRLLPTQAAS